MSKDDSTISSLLEKYRLKPSNEPDDKDLGPIFSHLVASTPPPKHWFCSQSTALDREAAYFLLRIPAYPKSEPRDLWAARFISVLSDCLSCTRQLQNARSVLETRYLERDSNLSTFRSTFDKVHIEEILKVATSGAKLASRSGLVYHIVYHWHLVRSPEILRLLDQHPLTSPFSSWPTDTLAPGILYLLLHENFAIQNWAVSQASLVTAGFFSTDAPSYREVLLAITATATHERLASSDFLVSDNLTTVWNAIRIAISSLPTECISRDSLKSLDLRRFVYKHLTDNVSHFPLVLKCFLLFLEKLGSKFWEGEGPEYPVVAFSSVKDNPAFLQMISNGADSRWSHGWFKTFLATLKDLPVIEEIVSRMSEFMFQELQHPRFGDERPYTMQAACDVLRSVQEWQHPPTTAVNNCLTIHAHTISHVAFGDASQNTAWSTARTAARSLVKKALSGDIKLVHRCVHRLQRCAKAKSARAKGKNKPPEDPKDNVSPDFATNVRFQTEIWTNALASLRDPEAAAFVLKVVAQISHFATLASNSLFIDSPDSGTPEALVFKKVNTFLGLMASRCLDGMAQYIKHDPRASDIFNVQPGFAQIATVLLISPVEQLSEASRMLIGLAFDVDERDECFRSLFRQSPTFAMTGIKLFLQTFLTASKDAIETSALTQSFVKCFSDVLEVLCAEPGGLLRDSSSLNLKNAVKGVHSFLRDFWSPLVECIALIYESAPSWANYVDTSTMVLWMRDALILGRDLLAYRPVFEAAIKQSEPGGEKKMVPDLYRFVPAFSQWLRLTDEELLHQSFSLLHSLLEYFWDAGVRPEPEVFAKLKARVEAARSEDPRRSRLDPIRVAQLESALSRFELDDAAQKEDDGSDVEILEHFTPAPTTSVPTPKPPKPDKSVRAIQISKGATKPITRPPIATARPAPAVRPPAGAKASVTRSYGFTETDKGRLASAASSIPSFRRASSSAGGSSRAASGSSASSAGPSSAAPTDSESSSSSDEEQGGLEALAKKQVSPVKVKRAERRQIQFLEIDIPRFRKLPVEQRPQVKPSPPNYAELHRSILAWNYEHNGPSPPGHSSALSSIPDTFKNVDDYFSIFRPLLFHECWAQLVQSKDEVQEEFPCLMQGRSYVDRYLVLDAEIKASVPKEWYLAETDIVLLKTQSESKTILAKVSQSRARPTSIQISLQCIASLDPGLALNSTCLLSKVYSLTTLHREFAALESIPYLNLREHIFKAQVAPAPSFFDHDVARVQKDYKLNEPQAVAVVSSLANKNFILIQGPPGTGKTSTICGLVSAAIAQNKKKQPSTASCKILVCAPSNAAIDEVCHRLDQVLGRGKVVRVGSEAAVNASVRDITLNALIDASVQGAKSTSDSEAKLNELRRQLESLKVARQKLISEKDCSTDPARQQKIQDEVTRMEQRRSQLSQQLNQAKDQQKSENRSLDAARRQQSAKVLDEADVICGTLSGSGHHVVEQLKFNTVIMDEAAQAVELSSLIPLKFNADRYILVGDPQQLAPTVISSKASDCKYNQSLFVRLQKQNPDAAHLLSIQYRMHPEISLLPSKLFYGGRLKDGPDMASKTQQPWHKNPRFGVYRFYNVQSGIEEPSGHSLKNIGEVNTALALYERLRLEYKTYDFAFKIGVITMYRSQLNELKGLFKKKFGANVLSAIDFNTVDGFQGQEKEIIILSCVRAGMSSTNIGFLADMRRMNVALTRAKSSLFVVGHAATLSRSNSVWKTIVDDAKERGLLVENTNPGYFRSRDPVAAPPPPKEKNSPKKKDPMFNMEAIPTADLVELQPKKPAAPMAKTAASTSASPSAMSPPTASALPPTLIQPMRQLPPKPPMDAPLPASSSLADPAPRPVVKKRKQTQQELMFLDRKKRRT